MDAESIIFGLVGIIAGYYIVKHFMVTRSAV